MLDEALKLRPVGRVPVHSKTETRHITLEMAKLVQYPASTKNLEIQMKTDFLHEKLESRERYGCIHPGLQYNV